MSSRGPSTWVDRTTSSRKRRRSEWRDASSVKVSSRRPRSRASSGCVWDRWSRYFVSSIAERTRFGRVEPEANCARSSSMSARRSYPPSGARPSAVSRRRAQSGLRVDGSSASISRPIAMTIAGPKPRRGVLMIRQNAAASSSVRATRRYAMMSRTSSRPKKATPPTITNGKSVTLSKAASIGRICAWVRVRMAISSGGQPSRSRFSISATINEASLSGWFVVQNLI